jgi:hypothetical protein
MEFDGESASSKNSRGKYEVHSVFFSLLLIPATISAQDDPRCFWTDPSIAFSCPIPGHHIYNQTRSLAHEKMQKAGGEIVMIDFHKKELPVGPPIQMNCRRGSDQADGDERISVNERASPK